jgi:hypothetical protein
MLELEGMAVEVRFDLPYAGSANGLSVEAVKGLDMF